MAPYTLLWSFDYAGWNRKYDEVGAGCYIGTEPTLEMALARVAPLTEELTRHYHKSGEVVILDSEHHRVCPQAIHAHLN